MQLRTWSCGRAWGCRLGLSGLLTFSFDLSRLDGFFSHQVEDSMRAHVSLQGMTKISTASTSATAADKSAYAPADQSRRQQQNRYKAA